VGDSHNSRIRNIAFSQDGKFLAHAIKVFGITDTVRVWDIESKIELQRIVFKQPEDEIEKLSFTSDCSHLLTNYGTNELESSFKQGDEQNTEHLYHVYVPRSRDGWAMLGCGLRLLRIPSQYLEPKRTIKTQRKVVPLSRSYPHGVLILELVLE
jgi:hypothetical protein